MKKINILGSQLDIQTHEQVLSRLAAVFSKKQPCHLVTPNPEIVLAGWRNHQYLSILNQAEINIIDGSGLQWAAIYNQLPLTTIPVLRWIQALWQLLYSLIFYLFSPTYRSQVIPQTITGTDLVPDIASLCSQFGQKLFLLGGKSGVARATAKILTQNFPQLDIAGYLSLDNHPRYENTIVQAINRSQATCLLVAYGAPKQEIWISRNLKKMPKVILAVGVGGAFDYLSQSSSIYGGAPARRAPVWLRNFHLEWLHRLIFQPQRWNRIFQAVIIFPWTVMLEKINSKK